MSFKLNQSSECSGSLWSRHSSHKVLWFDLQIGHFQPRFTFHSYIDLPSDERAKVVTCRFWLDFVASLKLELELGSSCHSWSVLSPASSGLSSSSDSKLDTRRELKSKMKLARSVISKSFFMSKYLLRCLFLLLSFLFLFFFILSSTVRTAKLPASPHWLVWILIPAQFMESNNPTLAYTKTISLPFLLAEQLYGKKGRIIYVWEASFSFLFSLFSSSESPLGICGWRQQRETLTSVVGFLLLCCCC